MKSPISKYPLVERDSESRRHVIVRLDGDCNWHRLTWRQAQKLALRIVGVVLSDVIRKGGAK